MRHMYPRDKTASSEYRAAARMLSDDERLREDIAKGNSEAIRFLRERAQVEARHMSTAARRAREERALDERIRADIDREREQWALQRRQDEIRNNAEE